MCAEDDKLKHPCITCKEVPTMMCRAECEEYNEWHLQEERKERDDAEAR